MAIVGLMKRVLLINLFIMKLINYISILLVFALTLSCVRSHNSRSVSVAERFKNIKEDSLVYITGKLDSATSDVINIEVP